MIRSRRQWGAVLVVCAMAPGPVRPGAVRADDRPPSGPPAQAVPRPTPGNPPGVVVLETIEVTAPPIPETQQRAPTGFVTAIDVTDRPAAIETPAEVLQETVGVQVQRFGGLGAFATISIRGAAANQVPVFLDGVPLSLAQSPVVNLSNLPLDGMERIEVYRGLVPVGFGGGGIGGVVNLVPARAPEAAAASGSVSYGSFETRKVVLRAGQRVRDVDTLATVTYLGSKGDFTYRDDNGTPENPFDDETVRRINNAFDAVGTLVTARRQLGGALRLDALAQGFWKRQGVPGPGSTQYADPKLTEGRGLAAARLRHDALAPGVIGAATLYTVYGLQAFDDPQGNFGVKQDTFNQAVLAGGSVAGTWFAPLNQAVGAFAEVAHDVFMPWNRYAAPYPADGPDQRRWRLTLAAQDVVGVLPERLSIVPSLRYDLLHDAFNAPTVGGAPLGGPMRTTTNLVTPALGVEARPVDGLRLMANVGRYQRPPSFPELFGNSGTVVGNPNLEPETALNADVGGSLRLAPRGWFDGGRIESAWFWSSVRDLIAFEAVSRSQFKAFNIGRARLTGVELAGDGQAFRHLGLTLNYTWQHTEDRSGIPSREGKQLPLRPANELFVHVEGFARLGRVFYEYTYISADPTDPANFIVAPARSIHTAGTALTPRPWLTLRFEAVNLTNADVRDLGDFPLPGLSFFGGVTVTL